MRKPLAAVAIISTVLLTGLAAPAPAQAVATCTVVAKAGSGGAVEVGPDGALPIKISVTTTNCPTVKTTKATVLLPGKDLSTSKAGKSVSVKFTLTTIKAGQAKAGTDYKVRTLVTFKDATTKTVETAIHFVANTKVKVAAAAKGGGKALVSGTLYRYDWLAKKWGTLSGKKVGWFYKAKPFTPTTSSSGKFSATMTKMPKGKEIAVTVVFGADTGARTYTPSMATARVTVK